MREILELGAVIPVITIQREADAVPLAKALLAGGLRVLEVTLRTPAGLESIRQIRAACPTAVVGAGTIVTAEDAVAAKESGAQFLVTPGSPPPLLDAALATGVPLLPGVATPTEVLAVAGRGLTVMKLFPAEVVGGMRMLAALAGPLPGVLFCPTGGITPDNAAGYLALPNVVCVGGSWMVPQSLVDAGDWAAIEQLASVAADMAVGPTHPK